MKPRTPKLKGQYIKADGTFDYAKYNATNEYAIARKAAMDKAFPVAAMWEKMAKLKYPHLDMTTETGWAAIKNLKLSAAIKGTR